MQFFSVLTISAFIAMATAVAIPAPEAAAAPAPVAEPLSIGNLLKDAKNVAGLFDDYEEYEDDQDNSN
ncbi:hypothetical protein N7490_007930 [Penicillium lividum]|nr:hypothetical protein N7490_007930 [Penicillium lividum]